MKRRAPLALTVLVGLLTIRARAQQPLLQLFPELNQLPAPAWLAEGVRLTFSSAVASSGIKTKNEEDEEEDVDTSIGSAAGFKTVDVVALDQRHVVLDIRNWVNLGAGMTSLSASSIVAIPSTGGEFWLHPDVLRKATDKNGKDLTVVRMPLTVGGKAYEVIRFQDEGKDHRYVSQFDTATGILVSTAARFGEEDGARTQSHMQLISRRRLERPWLNQPPPPWVATVRGFTYQGSLSTFVPGGPPMSRPVQAAATVKARGARWFEYDVAMTVPGLVGPETTRLTAVSGISQVGGLWLPPAGLRALRPGQLLDEDPTTRTRQVVSGTDLQSVTITYGSSIDSTEFLYEIASGQLVRFRRTQQIGVATQVFEASIQRQ